ncbi:hypothetical protein WR25_01046 [Diploscapter pachys]|uniref:Uncharacterized protein n=1 Tax=Diploscapter pachys TaxID=2018661 RepID=A0A2A2JT00_9BILA|nr:hypothetical protein WR25_01046 [Diploscapter pachys]
MAHMKGTKAQVNQIIANTMADVETILRNLPQEGDYVEVINLSSAQPSKYVSRTTKEVVACQQVSDVMT